FFQAEDGIRDPLVTGVQTCALPIFTNYELGTTPGTTCPNALANCYNFAAEPAIRADNSGNFYASSENGLTGGTVAWKSTDAGLRSEERRVGKECRCESVADQDREVK